MDYYEECHAHTVANCSKRCQGCETSVSRSETPISGRRAHPQTAPWAADPTSFAYFASTPVV
ncbi:MAG: hypothetical protein QOH68_4200 [Nocardioidaceae bacterium]|jgi:hypothetical protein|nr:hypothetical protein [Nocardioidaceae bacterium]